MLRLHVGLCADGAGARSDKWAFCAVSVAAAVMMIYRRGVPFCL